MIARDPGKQDDTNRSPVYDRFRDRVVFPIRDSRGRTVGFGGRVLDDGTPKYLNSRKLPCSTRDASCTDCMRQRKSKAGQADAGGRLHGRYRAGPGRHPQCGGDTGHFDSESQLQRMFRQAPEIVFCFDGDEAGRKAAWRALEITLPLMADGKGARFLFLPEGEDPDSMVRKLGAEKFQELVDAAKPLENFFFDHLNEGLRADTIEGKAALSSRAMPLIRKLPEGVYRQLMIDQLADVSGATNRRC